MIDNLANFFLSFAHDTVIIPLIVLGFIWVSPTIFGDALRLMLISILFNIAAKVTFQIPLSPALNQEGFAFPSGHMQCATVLYGWLAFKTQNLWLRLGISILLISILLSLVHCGYHNYYDVLGGLSFGIFLVIMYPKVKLKASKFFPWILFLTSTLLMLYIHFNYIISNEHWSTYYTLIGFMISEKIVGKIKSLKGISEKIITTVICCIILVSTKLIFSNTMLKSLPAFLYQLQWILIGFSLPASYFITNRIIKQYVRLSGNKS